MKDPHRTLTAGVTSALALMAACAPASVGAQDPPTPPPNIYTVSPEHLAALAQAADTTGGKLEVRGTAQVTVPADQATLSLAVETESVSAREASAQNADLMDAVMRAVRALDLDLRIETHGYNLSPRYERATDRGARRVAGYTAVNNVRVTTRDIDAMGRIIDAGVGVGANRVASLSFGVADAEDARLEALRQAVARARAEAQVIADAMGVTLGRPLEVTSSSQVPVRAMRFEAAALAADTPIEPGGQTVTATVMIRYRLESGGR